MGERRPVGKGGHLPLICSIFAFAMYFLLTQQSSPAAIGTAGNHVFGSGASSTGPSLHSDLIALDNIIFERREKLRKLQEENGALKEQQTQILEHAKSGKLLRSFGTSSKRQESRQNPVAHRDDAGTVKRSQIVQAQPLDQSHSQMQNFATSPSAYAPRTSLSRARTLVETQPQVTLPSSASVVTFWSQTAQKYLSVVSLEPGSHEYGWLRSDAEEGSPLSMRGFNIIPIDGEWVALKSLGTSRFVEMIPATERLAWVVRATGTTLQQRHHFRIEGSGRMFNRQSRAYINVITDTPSNEVRGHGNAPHKSQASSFDDAGVDFQMRTLSSEEVRLNEQNVQNQAVREHKKEGHYIAQIKALPRSDEKRVVSYGLYGSNPKYTTGAIRNAELVHVYFPGWVTRFYCDSSVPKRVLDVLRGNGAEIVFIENIKGGIAGMFWRFLVADDPTVDRWIVRDSDSRLNPRERFAVEEWIQSGKAMHTIRDHPNHERPMNGGLIGGTKHAIPGIRAMIDRYPNKNRYGGDLTFLTEKVWPMLKNNQIGHDSYSCHKFPNSRPFPTKRPDNYQHVGQVFLIEGGRDVARMGDINGFMKGRETPKQCRGRPEWRYG